MAVEQVPGTRDGACGAAWCGLIVGIRTFSQCVRCFQWPRTRVRRVSAGWLLSVSEIEAGSWRAGISATSSIAFSETPYSTLLKIFFEGAQVAFKQVRPQHIRETNMPALLRSALSSTPSVLREPSPTLSDASTSSSDSPIKYATGVTPKKATRQAKDWRPPSTFYLKPFSEMTTAERICNLATCPESMHELKDEDLDRGPVPTQSVFRENLFILTRGMLPLVLQGLSYWAFPSESPFRCPGETSLILFSQTSSGRWRWRTPSTSLPLWDSRSKCCPA